MEETVPTIHTSMVRCNIFLMTENNESCQPGEKPGLSKREKAVKAPRQDSRKRWKMLGTDGGRSTPRTTRLGTPRHDEE